MTKAAAQQIEVLDTLTKEKIVYLSIRKAAKAIGVAQNSISNALKYLKEEGEPKLIKNNRFEVKPVTTNEQEVDSDKNIDASLPSTSTDLEGKRR